LFVKLLFYLNPRKREILSGKHFVGKSFGTESKILESLFINSQDAARFARSCLRAKSKVKSKKAKGAKLNLKKKSLFLTFYF
jgi:hypothetical protein